LAYYILEYSNMLSFSLVKELRVTLSVDRQARLVSSYGRDQFEDSF